MPTIQTKPSNTMQLLLVLVMLVAAILAPRFLAPGLDWIVVLAVMFVFLATIGSWIATRPAGVLINERNVMSLSRFQLVLWTVLLLSAYWTIALKRIFNNVADPLAIAIAPELWTLLGISTTSLVASPLLLARKQEKKPTDLDRTVAPAAAKFKEAPEEIKNNSVGSLYANASVGDAEFTDLFEGEELGNTTSVDVSRVQMFFFTVIAGLSYAALFWKQMRGVSPVQLGALPDVGPGLLAVLGISHAEYLASKSFDHTSVQQ
jgi:hypothetical protein